MIYSEKLKDPRWQKKRLEILQRDNWKCAHCLSDWSTLHVHHLHYEQGKDPWEYENEMLLTLCEGCHEREHSLKEEKERFIKHLRAMNCTNTTFLVFNEELSDKNSILTKQDIGFMLVNCSNKRFLDEYRTLVEKHVHYRIDDFVEDLPFD